MNTQPRSRLPSLDGWRAFAIILVLGSHSAELLPQSYAKWATLVFDGNLGVRCFFVISGFLITWLLLREGKRGDSVNLKDFYVRRMLRIFPVVAAFGAVVWLLTLITPTRVSGATWLGILSFTLNYNGDNTLTAHLWSLSIEEQFYLVWPLCFLRLKPWRRPRSAIAACSAVVLLGPFFRLARAIVDFWWQHDWAFLRGLAPTWKKMVAVLHESRWFTWCSTTNYLDVIAIGCLGAILFFHYRDELQARLQKHVAWATAMAWLLLLAPKFAFGSSQAVVVANLLFSFTAQGFGFLLLLVLSLFYPTRGLYAVLNNGVIAWIGVLSYSLYVWQQLFWGRSAYYGIKESWWLAFPGWLLSAFGAATISYYFVERPFLRLKEKRTAKLVPLNAAPN